MKSVNNGAKRKLVAALEQSPKSIDELAEMTGLTRLQVIQNMHYLRTLGVCERKWCLAVVSNA